MFGKYSKRTVFYFLVSAVGLITAWLFNGIASIQGQNYLTAWFGSAVDWVLSLDLLVVAIALAIFMISEARRLKMKRVWLYFLLSGITALAFTFPLFMAFREIKLRQLELAGGKLETFEFDGHRVDVWTPDQKAAVGAKLAKKSDGGQLDPKTPILVMHDGRNIFDAKASFSGVTWGVLDAIRGGEIRGTAPVVIAVWGLSDETRLRELAPESIVSRHPEMWESVPIDYTPTGTEPFGDSYVSLISDAILPFVASRHGLELSPARTAIAGSSMGGLMSLYAMAQRPEVFGTALAFSTHWSLGQNLMVDELTAMLPRPGVHRVWTDCGTLDLDSQYEPFHTRAVSALEARGYVQGKDLAQAVYFNTGHSEIFWRHRISDAVNWWLGS